MKDPRQTLRQQQIREAKAREATDALQQAKLKVLQDTLGSYGDLSYVDWDDFIDPDNQNWADYTYRLPSFMVSPTESAKRYGHVNAGTPVGKFIQQIRDAENIDDVNEQLKIWNSYKPLDSYDNGRSYIRYFIPGFATRKFDYGGSAPVFPTTDGSDPGQTGTGGTQGGVAAGGAQGAQAGVQAGAGVVKGGTQGTQGTQTGGTGGTTGNGKPRMSDDEIDAFLNDELGGNTTGGTYASSGIPKGGTKTIGYNPIDEWNREHGISYATGKDGVIYRTDPQHPNGYVDPFKNDLSTWTRATRSGSTYATPGINTGGTYATGEGIKDANGNVLTNPGGDWEYQYALKNPQYGLGMMGKMSDAQRNYLQAVSDDMGYNYNFKGAARYV